MNAAQPVTDATVKLNARQVLDALYKRWPAASYLTIEEAPDGPARLGRKLDLLAVSAWKSRSYELDGVEVKVSLADWAREVKQPEKAEWWWQRVNRFWVAVPASIANKVAADLPSGWGLFSVRSDGTTVAAVKPQRHDARPLTWPECIGLMRASANAGFNALYRAREEGRQEGAALAETRPSDGQAQAQLERLRSALHAFHAQTGIDLERGGYAGTDRAAMAGRVFAAVTKDSLDPAHTARALRNQASALTDAADRIAKVADTYLELVSGSTP